MGNDTHHLHERHVDERHVDERHVYVGAMSGTSLDGIACAVVRFDGVEQVTHELLGSSVHPYTPEQRARLTAALRSGTPERYCRLNFDLGDWIARAVADAIADAGVARSEVRAIASHGQTVWHVPGHSTWQTGESAVIAERLGIDVISDFRVRDVAAGGQGAPLVPIADALLYASADRWRALQNIGGMANVSVVPPAGDLRAVRAFDTGPGVALIDALVRRHFPELPYDIDGRIARRGTPDLAVVAQCMTDVYFAQEPPKSTGREYFDVDYAHRLADQVMARGGAAEDVIATATELTAASIADAYRRFIPVPVDEILVSGGGANNPVLLESVARAVSPLPVRRFDDVYYDGEAKEAVAFALLAHLHLARRPGNVTGATGARAPRVLGKLTPA